MEHRSVSLIDRLKSCAALWCEATGRTPGALASIVVNHGSFFDRLESPQASTTTATLERFARYLGDAGNWPDGVVPDAVRDFVAVTGIEAVCVVHAPASTGGEAQDHGA